MNQESASVPAFETERLLLREATEKDVPAWREHLTDYEVAAHLTEDPWHYRFDPEALDEVQGQSIWMWGIFLKTQPHDLIGMVYLRREANPTNRGFWLGKEHWGKGVMSEALVPVMDYAFNVVKLERVFLGNAVGNIRSRRVKERHGAVLVRVEPARYIDPAYKEREVWELTKERWETFKASGP